MIKLWTFVLCCLVSCMGYGQELISLRSVPFTNFTDNVIHIDSVIDERLVKNLGTHENLNGETVTLALFQGAEKSIQQFFGATFPDASLNEGITIKVKALNVHRVGIHRVLAPEYLAQLLHGCLRRCRRLSPRRCEWHPLFC